MSFHARLSRCHACPYIVLVLQSAYRYRADISLSEFHYYRYQRRMAATRRRELYCPPICFQHLPIHYVSRDFPAEAVTALELFELFATVASVTSIAYRAG